MSSENATLLLKMYHEPDCWAEEYLGVPRNIKYGTVRFHLSAKDQVIADSELEIQQKMMIHFAAEELAFEEYPINYATSRITRDLEARMTALILSKEKFSEYGRDFKKKLIAIQGGLRKSTLNVPLPCAA